MLLKRTVTREFSNKGDEEKKVENKKNLWAIEKGNEFGCRQGKREKKNVRVDMDFYQTRVWEEKIKNEKKPARLEWGVEGAEDEGNAKGKAKQGREGAPGNDCCFLLLL